MLGQLLWVFSIASWAMIIVGVLLGLMMREHDAPEGWWSCAGALAALGVACWIVTLFT